MARAFYALWFVLFIVAALLQYNDPDPYFWAPLYGVPAYLCFRFIRNHPLSPRVLSLTALVYSLAGLGWFLAHRSELILGDREPLNESLGLGIVGCVVASLSYVLTRRTETSYQG